MEDLKQTPPASVESDAPSEYMRGYSDGLAQTSFELSVLRSAFLGVSAIFAEISEEMRNENAR